MAMKSFKEYTKSLKEGFLDDDNKEQLAADNFSTVEEKETPFPEDNLDDDLTTPNEAGDDDVDLSDELGTSDAEADKTEKEDLADLKLDELGDDDVKDSGDQKQEEKEAEREVAERTADNMAELKDAIATLTTKLEAISDKIDNAGTGEGEGAEGGTDDLAGLENLDLPAEGGEGEGAPAEGGAGEGAGASAEGGEATPAEGGEGAPAEGGEAGGEEEQNAGSDEDFGEDEVDETKSEAYNFYAKKGSILNSNSGSLIGKAMNDKLYEFQEDFMNIAKAKIRQLVEAEKKRLKENHFNF
jgi:hypothetical protein